MNFFPSLMTSCVVLLSMGRVVAAESPPVVRVLVWDERQPAQKEAYEGGFLGEAIAAHLAKQPEFTVRTASLESPEQGLGAGELDATDVVVWWGHVRHRDIEEKRVAEVVERVKAGRLALVALHSAHWSAPFVRLMEARALADARAQLSEAEFAALETVRPKPLGAPKREDALTPSLVRKPGGGAVLTLPGCCFPAYRADGKPSHVKTLVPDHPIAKGLPAAWDIPRTEMYDEPFHVPPPDAVIFEERWDAVSLVRPEGEHFRSGSLWQVGKGRVFYFRPGHETYPIYRQAENLRVVENAVRWLGAEVARAAAPAPKPATRAPSKLVLPGETFAVAERPAFVFLPPKEKRASPQPWIFYAPTLSGYPDEAERWMHDQGDIDVVVPLEPNSGELVRRYREAGAGDLVKLIVLKGQGHNFFEGFFHSQEVVDFAIARARAGAGTDRKSN